jgi:hypothetical protein
MDGLFTPLALMLLLAVFAVSALLFEADSRDHRSADTRHSPDVGDH